MWGHILISIIVLLASLLYHCHFKEPASVIDYPETHYDYIIGEFRLFSFFIYFGWSDKSHSRDYKQFVFSFETMQH